jgi:hypothetical protein
LAEDYWIKETNVVPMALNNLESGPFSGGLLVDYQLEWVTGEVLEYE